METRNFTLINKTLIRCLLVAVTILGGGNCAWGDELTINSENTVNSYYVPFYGYNANLTLSTGQFIIPSSSISSLKNKNITGITFYGVSTSSTTWGGATFSVYLAELEQTVFSTNSYVSWESLSSVYSGSLSYNGTVKTMGILFSNSFRYNGGNLLIGIKQINVGQSTSIQWICVSQSGNTSIRSYSGGTTSNTDKLLPKITFTYETPVSNSISASPNEDAVFGEVYDNANKVYSITNNGSSAVSVTPSISGTNASEFSISPSGATSIAAGGSQNFTFSFNYNSSSLGEKEATLTFTPSDEAYSTLEFSATATAINNNAPELSVTPDESATFGTVRANASKTYTITNSGTGTMTANITSDKASEFSISKSSVELGAGESTTFDVVFNFSAERSGNRSAKITVTPTYNAEAAVNITATATAITQPILGVTPSSASFSSMKVSGTKEIKVSNTGYGPMTVNISSSNETLFSVSPSSLTVAQDESKTFTITFNYDPSSLGYKSGSIYVTPTYDKSDKKTISVSATAIEAMFVSPDITTSFGNVTGSASRTYTITNLGASSMNVAIALSGSAASSFSLSDEAFSDIPVGESRMFTATFNYDSGSTGSKKSATIEVTPNSSSTSKTRLSIDATPQASSYIATTFDEDETPSWTSGTTAVKMKYSAQSGWNTFCVPFGFGSEHLNYIFGSGCKYYALSSYDPSIHQLTFNTLSTTVGGGNPILVYTESAPTYTDGVILTGRYLPSSTTPGYTENNGATFQGTYKTKEYAENDDWYGVTSSGQIMKAGSGAKVKGYRAYFTGISAPTADARITLVFEDNGEATDLGFVKMVDENAKDVYTLSGQKVQKGGKGIYVVNGRKVIIK